jgi:probable HAF family extracellular repeat protein
MTIRRGCSSLPALLIAVGMSIGLAQAAAAKTLYQFVPIVPPRGGVMYLGDMNDRGTIVGEISPADGESFGVVLPARGEPVVVQWPGAQYVPLTGVNNRGDSVGQALTQGVFFHALVRWADGTVADLHPPGAAGGSVAFRINASGVIVGAGTLSSWRGAVYRPVVWRDGVYEELPGLGQGGEAMDINDAGEIVGMSVDDAEQSHAVRWIGGRLDVLPGLPTGRTDYDTAVAVNAGGLAVGRGTWADGSIEACAWTPDGVAHDLGRGTDMGDSQARAVNDAGVIVGEGTLRVGGGRALLFRDGQAIDLNTLLTVPAPSPLSGAVAVDRAGRILVALTDGSVGVLLPWTFDQALDAR